MKPLVDSFRALSLWNSGEDLLQIAERFVGVSPRQIQKTITWAVENNLGVLARPLPESIPHLRKEYRSTNAPPKEISDKWADPREPIPANLPRCAPFNPAVEEILANAQPELSVRKRREERRIMDSWMVSGWEKFFADDKTEWDGTTYGLPWMTPDHVKSYLLHARRPDLWEKCRAALRLWKKNHPAPADLPAAEEVCCAVSN